MWSHVVSGTPSVTSLVDGCFSMWICWELLHQKLCVAVHLIVHARNWTFAADFFFNLLFQVSFQGLLVFPFKLLIFSVLSVPTASG